MTFDEHQRILKRELRAARKAAIDAERHRICLIMERFCRASLLHSPTPSSAEFVKGWNQAFSRMLPLVEIKP